MPGRALTGILLLLVVGALGFQAHAQSLEASVKANYLVRFAAFVQWPEQAFAGPGAPLFICVVGRTGFGPALAEAAGGQSAHGRPIRIRTVSAPAHARDCHILYVGGGMGERWPLWAAEAQHLLVVTDQRTSVRRGAVHFDLHEGRLRFHVDQGAARAAGLSINARLLALALSVTGTRS